MPRSHVKMRLKGTPQKLNFGMGKAISKNILYNHGRHILRISDILPIFPFTTSETKPNY